MILAVDPGTQCAGFALGQNGRIVAHGMVKGSRLGLVIQRTRIQVETLADRFGAFDLVVERATGKVHRGKARDLYMPGLSAGLWIEVWQRTMDHDRDPQLVPVSTWRRALWGAKKRWPVADPKEMAVWYCRNALGLLVPDHNVADACCLWAASDRTPSSW